MASAEQDYAALRAELKELETWLRDGEAYMEHPDGEPGVFRAADAIARVLELINVASDMSERLRFTANHKMKDGTLCWCWPTPPLEGESHGLFCRKIRAALRRFAAVAQKEETSKGLFVAVSSAKACG